MVEQKVTIRAEKDQETGMCPECGQPDPPGYIHWHRTEPEVPMSGYAPPILHRFDGESLAAMRELTEALRSGTVIQHGPIMDRSGRAYINIEVEQLAKVADAVAETIERKIALPRVDMTGAVYLSEHGRFPVEDAAP